MQPSARTPSSILRGKRANKENDDTKALKRSKLLSRRVSFAPDDELETRHLYSPKRSDKDSGGGAAKDAAGDANLGLVGTMSTAAQQELFSFKPHAPPVSPGGDVQSPLSMDLTNNSFQQHLPSAATTGMPYGNGGAPGASSMAQPSVPDYTRNITLGIPNLSTLVEEDEEMYTEVQNASQTYAKLPHDMTGAAAAEHSPPPNLDGMAKSSGLSPASPFVLNEMQRMADGADDDDVRNRWGFTPGADDTLEVSYGHRVLGDTTYNHVYGATATGDITNAMKAGGTGGPQHHGPVTRRMSSMHPSGRPPLPPTDLLTSRHGQGDVTAQLGRAGPSNFVPVPGQPGAASVFAPAALPPQGTAQLAQQQQQQAQQHTLQQYQQRQRHTAAMLPPHATPHMATHTMENTMKLLEDDQTDAWRLQYGQYGGAHGHTARASVASNRVGAHGRRYGETTALLGGATTQLLGTHNMTTNNMTAQLLAETTTNHRAAMERFLHDMPRQPNDLPRDASAKQHALLLTGDATAASISGMEQRGLQLSAQQAPTLQQVQPQPLYGPDSTADLPMDLGTSNDLLGEAGLSLDAFAMPPEPTMDLSQQMQQVPQQRQPSQQQEGQGLAGPSGSSRMERALALPLPSPSRPTRASHPADGPAAPQRTAPAITCQDFLCLIDVSFNDKVCRTSYLPQSDPPPRTILDVYEAAHITAPRVSVYQQMMIELSSRLASAQAHVQQLETQLAVQNPGLFAAVQLAPPAVLETIKDQMVNLKRLCRIRTVKAIKQTYLQSLDELLGRLDSGSAVLQQEMTDMKASVEQFQACGQQRAALEGAIAKQCEQEEADLQAAAAKRKAMEGQLQRLMDLRAQNAQRERRVQEARAAREHVTAGRVTKAELVQQRASLEGQLVAVRGSASVGLTPGREGQLARQIVRRREELAALQTLHGQQLDLSRFQRTGSFSMIVNGHFNITCTTSAGDACALAVSVIGAKGSIAHWSPSLAAAVGGTVSRLQCAVPSSCLPQALEAILVTLHRVGRAVQQLERSWLAFCCMLKPVVQPAEQGDLQGSSCGGGDGGSGNLVLAFLNADTSIRLSMSLPWESALTADSAVPPLQATMRSLAPAENEGLLQQLQSGFLSKLGPRRDYLQALCTVLAAVLQPAGQQQQQGSGPGTSTAADASPQAAPPAAATPSAAKVHAARSSAEMAQSTPHVLTAAIVRTPARMFTNPLFTAAE